MNGLRVGIFQWRTRLYSVLVPAVIYPRYLAPGPSKSSHGAMLQCQPSGMSTPPRSAKAYCLPSRSYPSTFQTEFSTPLSETGSLISRSSAFASSSKAAIASWNRLNIRPASIVSVR